MKTFISIYKSPKKEGMYIYLEKETGLKKMPESLIQLFGKPVLVTHMMIDENKKLAKVDSKILLASIQEKGFYLQLPDPDESYRAHVIQQNDKL